MRNSHRLAIAAAVSLAASAAVLFAASRARAETPTAGVSGPAPQAPGPAAMDATPQEQALAFTRDAISAIAADPAARAGDSAAIAALAEARIFPRMDFERLTASTFGPAWRSATPEQRARVQALFKKILGRVYSGALSQVDKSATVRLRPGRDIPTDSQDAIARTEVRAGSQSVDLDYRLRKGDDGAWRAVDVAVMGVWLAPTYRAQFGPEISKGGIDGLIARLEQMNAPRAAR